MAGRARDGKGLMGTEDPNFTSAQVGGLFDQWTAGLADVIASMADQKPRIEWTSSGDPQAVADILWWEQSFQSLPGALVWVATPRETWEYSGTLVLKAAGLETVETNEARNTWLEVL